ncbi:YjjW family glycine radical enzyme activase [Vibrio hepatarius]|uniref:YjjW family glycine radical enzyme activase n=1 Tax=Vibrio hepatarius TaxID=171383 RepID=UPI00373612FC
MTMLPEKQAKVSRILNFSCVDGPGNRLVIFLQGCNFNCRNCHNPHTINHCNHCGDCVESCPSSALSLNEKGEVIWDASACTNCDNCIEVCRYKSSPKISQYTVSEMVAVIKHHSIFISGITVSGGEATLQLPFIIQLFEAIKSDESLKHLTCFIDSNGDLSPTGWERVNHVLDGAMIDLKSWQRETHQWLVGKNNHRVIESVKSLAKLGKLHELRLLHIPSKSDLDSEIVSIIKLIRSLPKEVVIRLNAFQHHGVVGEALEWDKCSEQEMNRFHSLLAQDVEHKIQLPSVYT